MMNSHPIQNQRSVVFAMPDMDTHAFTLDIFIAQMAEFTNAQTGRIHEGNHGLLFQIGHGINQGGNLLF